MPLDTAVWAEPAKHHPLGLPCAAPQLEAAERERTDAISGLKGARELEESEPDKLIGQAEMGNGQRAASGKKKRKGPKARIEVSIRPGRRHGVPAFPRARSAVYRAVGSRRTRGGGGLEF